MVSKHAVFDDRAILVLDMGWGIINHCNVYLYLFQITQTVLYKSRETLSFAQYYTKTNRHNVRYVSFFVRTVM